jgi:hypothetical protein
MRTCTSADRDRIGTRVRAAPSSARTLRQRQYEQHEEHGRTFEWPASAQPGIGRRHTKFKFHWVRMLRRMRARSRCSEWRSRSLLARFPSSTNGRIAAALSCSLAYLPRSLQSSVADLGLAPVRSSACIAGSGAKWPVFLCDSSCASPTAGDGHCRERGCSRRLSDQPSRHRLRRRLVSPCRRASCYPRGVAIVHPIPAGITTAVVSVRACEHRRPRGEPARRSSSARAALAGRDGAGNRGVWG